ncbi:MAG: flagellar biosynthesis anti-sigma factor FlgM [Campylobacterota bacterium]|nr:flagellar biosynthesis anti-sigma factor FlgM [Campylobacterota bacterium]
MISQVNASVINASYQEATKSTQKTNNVTKQGDTSKIEQIKAEIEKGEYRIDLQALAEKIADEIM